MQISAFKPYAGTEGYRYAAYGSTVATAPVARSDITQEQIGFTGEYSGKLGTAQIKVGCWYQNADTMPPTSQKSYSIRNSGLAFKSWMMLSKLSGLAG